MYMKTITQEQINSIMEVLKQLNIPVQPYIGLQDLFKNLPPVETPKK